MRLNILLLAFTLSVVTFLVMAGNDHDHGHEHDGHSHSQAAVDDVKAKSNATNMVAELVKRKKLESSWAFISANTVEKKMFEGTPEWVVVFVNDAIADVTKQKLYVFLTVNGEYIAANYTGE
tara:strand:- start:11680 stop:12045 length:366 start_codon:yes stop_codon:yes gene_type:complete